MCFCRAVEQSPKEGSIFKKDLEKSIRTDPLVQVRVRPQRCARRTPIFLPPSSLCSFLSHPPHSLLSLLTHHTPPLPSHPPHSPLSLLTHHTPPSPFSRSHQLNKAQRELIWKFRMHCSTIPEALPKFLRCVDWADLDQVCEVHRLIKIWRPITLEVALELLDYHIADEKVRSLAVKRLEKLDNDELLCYLLQLVQV